MLVIILKSDNPNIILTQNIENKKKKVKNPLTRTKNGDTINI